MRIHLPKDTKAVNNEHIPPPRVCPPRNRQSCGHRPQAARQLRTSSTLILSFKLGPCSPSSCDWSRWEVSIIRTNLQPGDSGQLFRMAAEYGAESVETISCFRSAGSDRCTWPICLFGSSAKPPRADWSEAGIGLLVRCLEWPRVASCGIQVSMICLVRQLLPICLDLYECLDNLV
jgi:hypothetical protein